MKVARRHEAEIALGAKSRRLAEKQRDRVAPDRLVASIGEFIEWRTFAYWIRLVVEKRGACAVERTLRSRCPGFLDAPTPQRGRHSAEIESLWLQLIDWIDGHIFQEAQSEGWRHALGYYAARDDRLDHVREYWARCDEEWDQHSPVELPEFEDWRRAALGLDRP